MKTPITGSETNMSGDFTQRVLRVSQKYTPQWHIHNHYWQLYLRYT